MKHQFKIYEYKKLISQLVRVQSIEIKYMKWLVPIVPITVTQVLYKFYIKFLFWQVYNKCNVTKTDICWLLCRTIIPAFTSYYPSYYIIIDCRICVCVFFCIKYIFVSPSNRSIKGILCNHTPSIPSKVFFFSSFLQIEHVNAMIFDARVKNQIYLHAFIIIF